MPRLYSAKTNGQPLEKYNFLSLVGISPSPPIGGVV